jgi:hypothetical protein
MYDGSLGVSGADWSIMPDGGAGMAYGHTDKHQKIVFEDVLKERRYQDRQWGHGIDDTKKHSMDVDGLRLFLCDQMDEGPLPVQTGRHQ